MPRKSRFNLAVRPSIFKDGTFGVYAIPQDNSKLEYQLDSCFATIDEAQAVAEAYLKLGQDRLVPNSIEISQTREIELGPIIADQTEENAAQALKTHVKKLLADLPNSLSLKPFVTILFRITESTPYLLAIIAAIVFKFSLSVTVPKDFPILGDLLGGSTLGTRQVARLLPLVLLASTIILQFLARARGLVNSAMRDNILGLTLGHKWRREPFRRLYLEVIEAEGWGSLRKLGEWFERVDPDSLRKVAEEAFKHDPANPNEVKEELTRLYNEDFEARIHALYFMGWEPSFAPVRMAVNPLLFVLGNRRAVRRGRRLLTAADFRGYFSLSLEGLPNWEESRVSRRVFWGAVLWEVIALGGPMIWAFSLAPWPGALGWLGMSLMIAATIAPIVVWNYGLFVRNRGLPCAISWVDITGGRRLIRAL